MTVGYKIPRGRLIYAGYIRKTRARARLQEARTLKRSKELDERLQEKMDRRGKIAAVIERRIDKIERYPSKLGARLLKEIAASRNTPAQLRTRASAILLSWGDGEFNVRRRQGGRNQAASP